jgi:hypothetical protein
MEHLVLPEGGQQFIVVPYGAPPKEWYDHGGSFVDYPARKLWSEADLHGKDGFSHKGSDLSVQHFFQTWLFFGLLIECLKLGDVPVTTSDFLEQRANAKFKAVNTEKLPSLLQKWVKNIKKDRKEETVWNKLKPIFKTATQVLNRFCTPEDGDRSLKEEKTLTWPVRDEISTTMIAILFSLTMAAQHACDKQHSIEWPTARSKILRKCLERKWCLADASMFMDGMQIDGHYYFAASPSPKPDDLNQHYQCTKEKCLSFVDEDFYVTKHAEGHWHRAGCSERPKYGGQVGPERGQKDWVDAVCRIIDKGVIPVALWARGLRQLWSIEHHYTGKRRPEFVAISHVWSDGLGNPGVNSLPECQLDRIQHLVQELRWEGRKDPPESEGDSDGIGFWMDTLCIPKGKTDKIKECNKKAINDMRKVYTNAACVLILDAWLQEIPSTTPMIYILARLYQSNWLKRLWTHQEGFLPRKAYIQFSDRALDLESISSEDSTLRAELEGQGKYLDFHNVTSEMLVLQYTTVSELIKKHMQDNENTWRVFDILAHVMAGRRTTRVSDETLCLSTILGFDVNTYQEISFDKDEETAEKRMVKFLGRLKTFKMGIIFNNYDRLSIPGWRWAPKSLLDHRNAILAYEDDETSDVDELFGSESFLARYPGFLVKFSHGRPSLRGLERACAIQCEDRPISSRYVVVELPPNKIDWSSDWEDFAIILCEAPKEEERSYTCVLGLYEKPDEASPGTYRFRHLSIAQARLKDTPPPRIDVFKTQLIEKSETVWLVH